MAKIELSKQHNKSQEELNHLVERLKTAICDQYGFSSTQSGNNIQFKGSGIDGDLTVNAQQVDISINLGMMMSMAAPKIEATIQQALDKYLG